MARLSIILVALVAVAGVDHLVLADVGFDWGTVFPDDQTVILSARTWTDNGSPGPEDDQKVIQVTATRGPIVAGLCPISTSVTSSEPNLIEVRLQVGNDANQNGTIDTMEWQQVASTPANPAGTAASLGPVSVSIGHQAYRVEHVWTWGVSSDEILQSHLN